MAEFLIVPKHVLYSEVPLYVCVIHYYRQYKYGYRRPRSKCGIQVASISNVNLTMQISARLREWHAFTMSAKYRLVHSKIYNYSCKQLTVIIIKLFLITIL